MFPRNRSSTITKNNRNRIYHLLVVDERHRDLLLSYRCSQSAATACCPTMSNERQQRRNFDRTQQIWIEKRLYSDVLWQYLMHELVSWLS
jgi:hypothetical protein